MIDEKRKDWLRGAYLDRITETAMHFAADHTHFADAEWESYIAGAFEYLTELKAEDHDYLREAAGLEAWKRIRDIAVAAREAAYGKLRGDNTDVISPDARFAMDIGWIPLLQHAADRVRTYPESWKASLVGGKEKYGCCVVHIACDYEQRGCRSEVERLREEVRLRSLGLCEICGSSGRLRLSSYAKTVCDQHAVVMGEFREDDGLWADPWTWGDDAGRIDDRLATGRALMSEYPAESVEILRGMDPVRPRPKGHVMYETNDPLRETPIGQRIDDDTWSKSGREQELLIEFGWHLQDAVNGAAVKIEYLGDYVRNEISGWRDYAAQPLTASDEEFLGRYLQGLILEEYERIRLKQEAERKDE